MARKLSTADSVAVLAERIEGHTRAVQDLLEAFKDHSEKDEHRFRALEQFQWKALGALMIVSALGSWLLSKL